MSAADHLIDVHRVVTTVRLMSTLLLPPSKLADLLVGSVRTATVRQVRLVTHRSVTGTVTFPWTIDAVIRDVTMVIVAEVVDMLGVLLAAMPLLWSMPGLLKLSIGLAVVLLMTLSPNAKFETGPLIT